MPEGESLLESSKNGTWLSLRATRATGRVDYQLILASHNAARPKSGFRRSPCCEPTTDQVFHFFGCLDARVRPQEVGVSRASRALLFLRHLQTIGMNVALLWDVGTLITVLKHIVDHSDFMVKHKGHDEAEFSSKDNESER